MANTYQNSVISLTKDSEDRTNALNSLKFTLLLNYKLPDCTDPDSLIDNIMTACQECCSGLFADNQRDIKYDFFGKDTREGNLPCLNIDYYKYINTDFNNSSNPMPVISFHDMILQHCVMSSYHAVLTALYNQETVSSYYIKNTGQGKGMNRLLSTSKFPKNSRDSQNSSNRKKSSTASDFMRTSKTHITALPGLAKLFLHNDTGKDSMFYVQLSGLYKQICNIRATKYKSLYNASDPFLIIQNIIDIKKSLEKNVDADPVDRLYHQYLIERIFHFDLISCLLQSVYQIEKDKDYSFRRPDLIETLCQSQYLPNSFSRSYFVHYAFDKFYTKPASYADFWHNHFRARTYDALISLDGIRSDFQFADWQLQFGLFCKYLSEFVIPMYEWCFMNMLMEIIEKHSYDDNTDSLEKAREILSSYIFKNHQLLMQPLGTNKQYSKKSFKITNLKYINLPNETVMEFFNLFYRNSNTIDLNLKKINPKFFSNIFSSTLDPLSARMRDVYICLQRDSFLYDISQ